MKGMLCLIFKCVSIRICLSFQPRLITNLLPRALIPPIANMWFCASLNSLKRLSSSKNPSMYPVSLPQQRESLKPVLHMLVSRVVLKKWRALPTKPQLSFPRSILLQQSVQPACRLTQLLLFRLSSRRSSITMPFWR